MNLFDAVNETAFQTTNGMMTLGTSTNDCLDMFYLFGASRGKDITSVATKAASENLELAMRIALWGRDIRGGAGERTTFRNTLKKFADIYPEETRKALPLTPVVGRWDDLLVLHDSPVWDDVVNLIRFALFVSNNGLCAKWMPRKGEIAHKLRNSLRMSPKKYRTLLVSLSNTVEQQMCAGRWDEIVYQHVPSVAMSRYMAAFHRNDGARFAEFKESLKKGEAKVNASALFPHDVVRSIRSGDRDVAMEQWKSLPNYMEGSTKRILPMVDVSGSMYQAVSGRVQAVDVAMGIGMYISERNEGPFKDMFLTFSGQPTLERLRGNLVERMSQLSKANWGMNTDIEKAFQLILDSATKVNLPASEMPNTILILSDMEFDEATRRQNTAFQMIAERYEAAGYVLPEIVFWNLCGRVGNIPTKSNQSGVALVSGFSPSILKSLIKGEIRTPEQVMIDTVMVDRYRYK